MDGRIKELAKQAGGGPSKWYTDEDVLEYFVELIVKECALQCNHNDDMDRILEYFGVKE